MSLDPGNPLTEALNALKVATAPASAEFRQWISTRYPDWAFADVFCSNLPSEWSHVSSGHWDLCYLSGAKVIRETCQRMDGNHQLKNVQVCCPSGHSWAGAFCASTPVR